MNSNNQIEAKIIKALAELNKTRFSTPQHFYQFVASKLQRIEESIGIYENYSFLFKKQPESEYERDYKPREAWVYNKGRYFFALLRNNSPPTPTPSPEQQLNTQNI